MRSITMAHGPNTDALLKRIAAVTAARPTLDVSQLKATSLPALPPTLTELYCYDNQLTELPALPPGLKTLVCDRNQLSRLPALPPTLEVLYCHSNQLTELPALPPALKSLLCDENQLTVLPDLPPALEMLYCQENQITVLPALPGSLKELECYNNPISKITSEFPPGVKKYLVRHVFGGSKLQFLPGETLEQYYFAPPRVDKKGNAIPGGPGYVETAAKYGEGQMKLGGGGRRTRRRRKIRSHSRGPSRGPSVKKRFHGK